MLPAESIDDDLCKHDLLEMNQDGKLHQLLIKTYCRHREREDVKIKKVDRSRL
jgi:hypothetical protein